VTTGAISSLEQRADGSGRPIVSLDRVSRSFPGRGAAQPIAAACRVELSIAPGESVALVGRSGAGKSTVARLVVGLERPDEGVVRVLGEDLASIRGGRRRATLAQIGLILQDPYAALSPAMTVLDIVLEPLRIGRVPRSIAEARAARALTDAGVGDAGMWARTSDELSGGERQRVGLARAIAPEPALLLADEPTSMLDASRQLEFLALLRAVRSTRPMALLFITHDLALAAAACDRLVVIDAGRIVEDGPCAALLTTPEAAATRALVAAARARSALMAAALDDPGAGGRPGRS
jgi:ABC-type glutathione transport system ATPase component